MNRAAPQRLKRAGFGSWAAVCFVGTVMLCFAVSPMSLSVLNINYDGAGGAAWQKIHPATYVMALAVLFGLVSRPEPLAFLRQTAQRLPGLVFFMAMWALLTLYGVAVRRLPLAPLLETYFIAVAALVIYDELPPRVQRLLRLFLHVFMGVNALIGVTEFVSHLRLFPYEINGEEIIGDRRSTALMGHPLQNAAASGAYLLCLFLGGDAALAPLTRVAMILLQLLGLAAFGGRTSLVASLAIILVNLAWRFIKVLMGARFDMRRALGLAIGLPLALGLVVYALAAGTFDDLIARFIDDNGSAEARIIMVRLFEAFDLRDLLIGPDTEAVSTKLASLGISIGIENTWIALMFQYGALMTLFFVLGLFALFWEYGRRSRRGVSQLFLFFLVLVSSAIGLAAKAMIFNHFALMLLILFSKERAPAPVTEAAVLEPSPPLINNAARILAP